MTAEQAQRKKQRLWRAINAILDDPHIRIEFKRMRKFDGECDPDKGRILLDPLAEPFMLVTLHEIAHAKHGNETDEQWMDGLNEEYDEEMAWEDAEFLAKKLTPRQYGTLFKKIVAALGR